MRYRDNYFIQERRKTMKKLISILFALALLAAVSLVQVAVIKAQEEPAVEVEVGVICRD
jgi:hypothetical protein